MKRKWLNTKKAALMGLVLTLSLSGSCVAFANELVLGADVQDAIESETAYDGTPSKVIGAEGYVREGNQISLYWNNLTTDNVFAVGGKNIEIGYEIEVNGQIYKEHMASTDDGHYFITGGEFHESYAGAEATKMAAASYRVRGIYFTYDEKTGKVMTYKVGEWSDAFKLSKPVVVANPSSLQIVQGTGNNQNTIYFSWNKVTGASNYTVYFKLSDKPLPKLTSENWNNSSKEWTQDGTTADYSTYRTSTSSGHTVASYYDIDENTLKSRPYIYARVVVNGVNDYRKYSVNYSKNSSPVVSATLKSSANIAVKPLTIKVEKRVDGGQYITWPKVAGMKVAIFEYSAAQFPANYAYSVYSARSAAGNSLREELRKKDSMNISLVDRKVKKYDGIDGTTGEYYISNYGDNGVAYFVAYTYKTDKNDEERAAKTILGVPCIKYNDVSAPSNIVSAKEYLNKPSVEVNVKKTSIGIKVSYSGSGVEIYKKQGKKWVLLARTTDNNYTDSGLKTGTTCEYRVRAYSYNKNTQKTAYSEYQNVSAKTGEALTFGLKANILSNKKVKLSWKKVKGASKIEVYRSETDSVDAFNRVKRNSGGNETYGFLSTYSYKLVKKLGKGAKSYTDKSLKAGLSYTYVVRVYYKNGKVEEIIDDAVSVYMDTPSSVSGLIIDKSSNAINFSWTANKLMKAVEFKYYIVDEKNAHINPNQKEDGYTYVSTSSNKLSIGGMKPGCTLYYARRILGKDGRYTSWTTEYTSSAVLGVVSGVKASKQADGIKITWNAVSGADYYKVYRTTKKPYYDAQYKGYAYTGTSNIMKQNNDDEGYDSVVWYTDFDGITDSVVGTTAVDRTILDTGVKYYYAVCAYKKTARTTVESASLSKPATVTTSAGKASIKKLTTKKGSVTVSINKVAGASSYDIYRSTSAKANTFKLVASTKKLAYTDKKVSKGKTYYYKVVAKGKTPILGAQFESAKSASKKIKVK